ncbi:MAG TPA: hypothetical protein G4O02_12935, partial [Caldilineae bacterium]|nr:hypothetical protein [Caldilineae bacterium]
MVQRIAYGFEPDLPGFEGMSPEEAGRRLREIGCDGVFMHHPDRAWVDGLHAARLRVYVSQGIFAGRGIWGQFPSSRPITDEGTLAPREEWYEPAIPTLPELRAYRLDELEDTARSAPIDGLWLDFIRWPARWEKAQPRLYHSSFDPITLRQFQEDTGISLPEEATQPAEAAHWILAHAAEPWFDWRCQQIVSFVAEARARLHRHLPDALLGMFTVPWTEEDFNGTFIRIVGQDPARLASHVDVFSPMVYHRLCGRDVAWIGQVSRWVHERSGRSVWPIIEAIASPDEYPASEFAATWREALNASAGTAIVFTLTGLLQDPTRVNVWEAS